MVPSQPPAVNDDFADAFLKQMVQKAAIEKPVL